MFAGECMACPSGTYRPAGASSCVPCAAGRVTDSEASPSCATCPAGTYADNGLDCVPCPDEQSTMFPGAATADQCQSLDDISDQLDAMFNRGVLADKLLSLPTMQLGEEQHDQGEQQQQGSCRCTSPLLPACLGLLSHLVPLPLLTCPP